MDKSPLHIVRGVEGLVRPPGWHGATEDNKYGVLFQGGWPRDSAPSAVRGLATRQFNTMVTNVETILGQSTAQEVRAGREWYPSGQDHSRRMGKLAGHRIDSDATDVGAGVIAALSPSVEWDLNLINAHSMATTGRTFEPYGKVQTDKASDMLRGANPEDTVITGGSEGRNPRNKSYHFYRNLKDPSDPAWVTVDRHAHDAATGSVITGGERGLSATGRYDKFADIYRTAAARQGMDLPSTAQAQTWGTWKRLKGGKRPGFNFDQYLHDIGDYDRYYSL